jgi:hypothetical protein
VSSLAPASPAADGGEPASLGHVGGAAAEVTPLGARFGAFVGVALTILFVAEVYLGVVVAFDVGQAVLGVALALDACARVLGTIAAGHAGLRDWLWLCALGGSPLVASFAAAQREWAVTIEPTPLAGRISLLAMGIAALGGIVALAGS